MPGIFSKLLPVIGSAYGVQILFASIFVPQHNDKFYDLCGSLGYLSTIGVSLYYPALRAKYLEGTLASLPSILSFAPRQVLVSAALGLWTARMGTYLASRALQAGGDSRFDEIKTQPRRFSFYWVAQATWILLVGLPVYLCNIAPVGIHPPLGTRDYAAIGLFAGSFILEVVADMQKHYWRKAKDAKQHDEKFLSSGLWGISRHPNYVGEIGIQSAIWLLSTSSLQAAYYPRGMVALALASPLFTYYILRKLSGVPPLERQGDKRFGSDPKWQEYKRTVPVFWPWGGYKA
ncbi:hypothetical protein EYR40_007644 [Pleurotus pulmonarius]|nr:hypothetical protein EYR36_008501 [Pleurotus pulmonarius]KAF4596664.1 hypothetical protein EYR38_008052 [Pleurotus pulmonarius]KAF4597193.1 hypothetical protein EYR40_007644 [Pleurotus pulmonarius]